MASPTKLDPELRQFCRSDRQREFFDAVLDLGSVRAAAAYLKVNKSSVTQSILSLRTTAASRGYSPSHDLTKIVPDPLVLRGTSTFYDRDGKVRSQWVKTKLDDQKYQLMLQAVADAMAEELPRVDEIKSPTNSEAAHNLANLYVMTDAHIGMLASIAEGGSLWNLEVAERTLVGCFTEMTARAPEASTGVICQLGDWLHFDGFEAVTDRGKHVLDASGRFHEVMQAGVRVLRRLIDTALLRHEKVILILAEGNHDQRSANWMQVMFSALYELEPRIQVIQTPKPYYALQHGSTALFFTHGHLAKGQGLALMFAADFSKIWGATTKRYAHTGHLHSVEEKEYAGVRLVQHPTLAARDAYATRGGWLSERQASVITYHREFGEVGRLIVTPEMLT
jgi:hypothetical protein